MFFAHLRESPPVELKPLPAPPRPRSVTISMSQHSSSPSDHEPEVFSYPFVLRKPFSNPHETLHHALNVAPSFIAMNPAEIPHTFDFVVLQDAPIMPTHVLAVFDTLSSEIPSTSTSPRPHSNSATLIPVNAELFSKRFNYALSSEDSSRFPSDPPSSHWDERRRRMMITLPVIHLQVPHPPSLSLLLLFGLGLHHVCEAEEPPENTATAEVEDNTPVTSNASVSSSDSASQDSPEGSTPLPSRSVSPYPLGAKTSTGLLATYLLPTAVIEEFPAYHEMVNLLARTCSSEDLAQYIEFNGGLWKNTLKVGPKDADIVDIVRTAWNVTREAKQYHRGWRDAMSH